MDIKVRLLTKPFQYFISNKANPDFHKPRWLLKVRDTFSSKTFLLLFGDRVYQELKIYSKSRRLGSDMYNSTFTFGPNRHVLGVFDESTNDSFDSAPEIANFIAQNINLQSGVLDENIFTSYIVNESWLDEPVIYGSICTKCSRDYPWIPQDSEYVCYGCKIGY